MTRCVSAARALALVCSICAIALLGACDSGGDGGGTGDETGVGAETGETAETGAVDETAETGETADATAEPEVVIPDWHASMDLDDLIDIAEQIGLPVSDGATHVDLVSMLEDATGCGCFGATCGVGACDHDCGGDSCLEGQFCFAGNCEFDGACPMKTTTMLFQDALYYDNGDEIQIRYTAEVDGDGIHRIRIYSTRDSDDPLGPGTYQLRAMDPWDCDLCVAAYRGCNSTGCQEAFMSEVGWFELDKANAYGDFVGTLHEAKFQLVDGDPYTGDFSLIPKAETMCVEEFAFDGVMASTVVVDPDACSGGGTGTQIGDKIEDFTVNNCYGEEVALYDFCGANAVWLVAAAGW